LLFQPLVNHNPGTIAFKVNFASPVNRPGTRPVQEPFAAHGNRTNTAGDGQITLVARTAPFRPFARVFGNADEACVHARKDRYMGIHFREELYACPARQGNNRINLCDPIPEEFEEFPIALSFNRGC
jgi:hypothetical protein